MATLGKQLAAATVSALVTGFTAYGLLVLLDLDRDDGADVAMVDNTDEVREFFEERSRRSGLHAAESPARAMELAGYPPPIVREPLDEENAKKLFSALEGSEKYYYEPVAHIWQRANLEANRPFAEHPEGGWISRTNDRGFRKDRDVLKARPDLRILVAGDSHTAGVVPNADSFANLLERLLADSREGTFESLNGGIGGTGLYCYLGVLEHWIERLELDVFVMAVYGGNDFKDLLKLHRYHNRLPSPKFSPHGGQNLNKFATRTGFVAQQLAQAAYFADNPGDERVSLDACATITAEAQRLCDRAGIQFICLYIPAAQDAQPELYDEGVDEALEVLGMIRAQLEVSQRIGAGWMEFARGRGIPVVDMGPIYAASAEPCYWFSDLHINLRGHRLAAEALLPVVASELE